MRRAYLFLLILPFFTLNSEYRKNLFFQIHEIVFHGKGGYSWETVYNMPIWLRKFTHSAINEFYIKEKEEYDKAAGKEQLTAQTSLDKIKSMAKVAVPDFVSKVKAKPKK